jgi:deoxyadenosine/deoxycytidine kinase
LIFLFQTINHEIKRRNRNFDVMHPPQRNQYLPHIAAKYPIDSR